MSSSFPSVTTQRQSETVERLLAAAEEELRAVGYGDTTVRNVARRAGVAPATAYTYFSSLNHLVTAVFWRRIQALGPPSYAEDDPLTVRISAALSELALVVADERNIAAAVTTAMLADEANVAELRAAIGRTWRQRIAAALGSAPGDDLIRTFEFLLSGALVHAGMEHLDYRQLPEYLGRMSELIINDHRGAVL